MLSAERGLIHPGHRLGDGNIDAVLPGRIQPGGEFQITGAAGALGSVPDAVVELGHVRAALQVKIRKVHRDRLRQLRRGGGGREQCGLGGAYQPCDQGAYQYPLDAVHVSLLLCMNGLTARMRGPAASKIQTAHATLSFTQRSGWPGAAAILAAHARSAYYRRAMHEQPLTSAPRRIAHLDMDAFYASVELLRYPQLRGLPVVIGGSRRGLPPAGPVGYAVLRDYAGRGVVTTATYAAREFGVHSAMGLMKAARLCPHAVLLPVDFDQYRRYSREFKAVIAQFTPVIEDRGVDEVYIDFDAAAGGQEQGGRTLALAIHAAIMQRTGLTCSIGVAPNKLIAKMASEFHKPNGVSIVYESELAERIWPLPCRRING